MLSGRKTSDPRGAEEESKVGSESLNPEDGCFSKTFFLMPMWEWMTLEPGGGEEVLSLRKEVPER